MQKGCRPSRKGGQQHVGEVEGGDQQPAFPPSLSPGTGQALVSEVENLPELRVSHSAE